MSFIMLSLLTIIVHHLSDGRMLYNLLYLLT